MVIITYLKINDYANFLIYRSLRIDSIAPFIAVN